MTNFKFFSVIFKGKMPVKFRRLKEVPMEKNGTHKARSTRIQSFLKLNIFYPESGEQFQNKAVSVT